jgi:hypothetical protein
VFFVVEKAWVPAFAGMSGFQRAYFTIPQSLWMRVQASSRLAFEAA